jgi:hypothetical protein
MRTRGHHSRTASRRLRVNPSRGTIGNTSSTLRHVALTAVAVAREVVEIAARAGPVARPALVTGVIIIRITPAIIRIGIGIGNSSTACTTI